MKARNLILAGLCLLATPATSAPNAAPAPRVIEITAKKFSFTPDHVTIKKGETVILRLTSADRVHGFFQRTLDFDADIQAGKSTDVTLTPDKPGQYPVICDHYCGWGHGGMAMTITVE
jgi:cytochrome c oxidase subunit 2